MSKIEWTDQTWNMVTGCNKISPGCRSCYAEVMHRRLMGMESQKEKYFRPFNDGAFPYEPALEDPFLQKKPTMFFSPSMSDLFHKNIPLAFIAKVWAVMYLNPHHTFQVLTKRWDRLRIIEQRDFHELFIMFVHELIKKHDYPHGLFDPGSGGLPLKNVWLGVSCESNEYNHRITELAKIRAAVHFVSAEPLIAALTLPESFLKLPSAWVICGGESGRNARPMHPDWARSLRDQCEAAGVPFFFKQWGEYIPFEQSFDVKCNITKGELPSDVIANYKTIESNDWKFTRAGKKHTGNRLDFKQHINFPNA